MAVFINSISMKLWETCKLKSHAVFGISWKDMWQTRAGQTSDECKFTGTELETKTEGVALIKKIHPELGRVLFMLFQNQRWRSHSPMSSSVLSIGSFSRQSLTMSRLMRGSDARSMSSSSSSSSESTAVSGRPLRSMSPGSFSVAYKEDRTRKCLLLKIKKMGWAVWWTHWAIDSSWLNNSCSSHSSKAICQNCIQTQKMYCPAVSCKLVQMSKKLI